MEKGGIQNTTIQLYVTLRQDKKKRIMVAIEEAKTMANLGRMIGEQMQGFFLFKNLQGLKGVNIAKAQHPDREVLNRSASEVSNPANLSVAEQFVDGEELVCDLNSFDLWIRVTIEFHSKAHQPKAQFDMRVAKYISNNDIAQML